MDIFSTLYRLHIIPFIKKWNLLNLILGALDIFAIFLAFESAYLFIYAGAGLGPFFFMDRTFQLMFLGVTPFWLLTLYLLKPQRYPDPSSISQSFGSTFLRPELSFCSSC